MTQPAHFHDISAPLTRLAATALCFATVVILPLVAQPADSKPSMARSVAFTDMAVTTKHNQSKVIPSPEQVARLDRIEKTAKAWNKAWIASAQD